MVPHFWITRIYICISLIYVAWEEGEKKKKELQRKREDGRGKIEGGQTGSSLLRSCMRVSLNEALMYGAQQEAHTMC